MDEKNERKAIKEKIEETEKLLKEIKAYKAFMLLNLKKTPALLQQKIRRVVKENMKGSMKAVRKPIIQRALKSVNINNEIDFPAAVILMNENPYKAYKIINENKLDVAAKPGDISPFDIVIPAGETDLQPGPALSQLKAAGLNVKIEKGKIVIAKDSVLLKKGEVVTQEKAQVLQMLGIKPFKVGVNLVFAYDGLMYTKDILSISEEELKNDMLASIKQAFNMSVNANYASEISIKYIMLKAIREARNAALNGNLYSDTFIKYLLIKSIREANALQRVAKV